MIFAAVFELQRYFPTNRQAKLKNMFSDELKSEDVQKHVLRYEY